MKYRIEKQSTISPYFKVEVQNDHNDGDYEYTTEKLSKEEFEFWLPLLFEIQSIPHFYEDNMNNVWEYNRHDNETLLKNEKKFFEKYLKGYEVLTDGGLYEDFIEDFKYKFLTNDSMGGPHSLCGIKFWYYDENNSEHNVTIL
jgi:hypothetical protein